MLQKNMRKFLKNAARRLFGTGIFVRVEENADGTTYIIRAYHDCGFKSFARMRKDNFHYYHSLTAIDALVYDLWEYANDKRLFDLIGKLQWKI